VEVRGFELLSGNILALAPTSLARVFFSRPLRSHGQDRLSPSP